MSIDECLRARKTGGFDYLRIVLSLSVLLWHNIILCAGVDKYNEFGDTLGGLVVRIIIPLFFALSGFLISMSLDRTRDLPVFLWHRFIRIYPALIVEVILSAFLIGTILTNRSLKSYFDDPLLIKYLSNTFGYINYRLPGVFENNPLPNIVNGSLWTVPYELECYAVIWALALFGIFRRALVLYIIFIIISLIGAFNYWNLSYTQFIAVPGRMLVVYFLAGSIVYHLRTQLTAGLIPGIIAFIFSAATLYMPSTIMLSPLPVAYCVAALGCTNPIRLRIVSSGDYSYGIYLYAFPIQQSVIAFIGGGKPFVTLFVTIALVVPFAIFSWHAIEKPMLRWKNYVQTARETYRRHRRCGKDGFNV